MALVQRTWYWNKNYYKRHIDIFLYSHHLSAQYCIDIIWRNSVLVAHVSERVKDKVMGHLAHKLTLSWR